jgi:hypothetical protein
VRATHRVLYKAAEDALQDWEDSVAADRHADAVHRLFADAIRVGLFVVLCTTIAST